MNAAPRKQLRAVLYARVSTDDKGQDPESQLITMRRWAAEVRGWRVVAERTDHMTSDPRRRKVQLPGLTQALSLIRLKEADVLAVFSAERLPADPIELLKMVERVQRWGGHVASYLDGADLDTLTDEGTIGTFLKGIGNRMRLRNHRAHTVAGMARARAAGALIGRPQTGPDPAKVAMLHIDLGLGWKKIAGRLQVDRCAVRRAFARWEQSALQEGVKRGTENEAPASVETHPED